MDIPNSCSGSIFQYSPLISCLSLATTQNCVESAQINVSHLINAKGENNLTLIRQLTSHSGLVECAQGLKNRLTQIKKGIMTCKNIKSYCCIRVLTMKRVTREDTPNSQLPY